MKLDFEIGDIVCVRRESSPYKGRVGEIIGISVRKFKRAYCRIAYTVQFSDTESYLFIGNDIAFAEVENGTA